MCIRDRNIFISDDGQVFYNTSIGIGGFQFNVEGAAIVGSSGGAAADAGFEREDGGDERDAAGDEITCARVSVDGGET